jgi:hypothetical protein
MGVTYEVLDVTYPYVSAVYDCPCGKHVVRHASEAGTAKHAGDEADYICPECARRRAQGLLPPQQ